MNTARKFLNSNAAIIIMICGIGIMVFWNDFTEFRQNQIEKIQFPTYIEITTAIYDVSNQCIKDHYADKLTNDGMVFSVEMIKTDCQATRLGEFKTKIFGVNTPEEIHQQAVDMYNKVIELGGNSTFMESTLRKSTTTDEIIEDWTHEIRNDKAYEDEDEIPEEDETWRTPPTPSLPSFDRKQMTV